MILAYFIFLFSVSVYAQDTLDNANEVKLYSEDELSCADYDHLKWNGEAWECWPKEDFENYNEVEL
jgi:hypothetical protein